MIAAEREPISGMVDRLRRLPVADREWTVADPEVEARYGLSMDTMVRLVAAGLPYIVRDGVSWFDDADLHYVGMRLGTAKSELLGPKILARVLRQAEAGPGAWFTIRYIPQLEPGDERQGALLLPGGEVRYVRLTGGVVAADVTFNVRAVWPRMDENLVAAINELGDYDWYKYHHRLIGDMRVARSTGLVECRQAATFLLDACLARGFDARLSHGLLLSSPYAVPHNWVEVRLDGVWTPLNPFLVSVVRQFGGEDSTQWPLSRPIGAVLARTCEHVRPLMWDSRGAVPCIFRTTLERSSLHAPISERAAVQSGRSSL